MQVAQATGDESRWSVEIALGGDLEGWRALVSLVIRDDRLTLAELRLFPGPPVFEETERELGDWREVDLDRVAEEGISARLLRRVPVGELTRFAHSEFASTVNSPVVVTSRKWARAAARQPARPGRAGRDDAFYLLWAERYARAAAQSDRPIIDLSKRHKERKTRVRDLVHEARRRDLLTPGVQGRAGGSLTHKAKELLKEAEQ